jgi:hypothetical protein
VLLLINFASHRGKGIGEGCFYCHRERQRQGNLAFTIPAVSERWPYHEGPIRAIMQTCCESQYNQQTFGIALQLEIQIVSQANDPKDAL